MKNWKTTVAGIALAALYSLVTSLTTGMTLKDAALAAALVGIGLLAKDFDTTGNGSTATKLGS